MSTDGSAGSHAASNTTSPTVVITTQHSFLYSGSGAEPTITFTRSGTGTPGSGGDDSISFSISGASGGVPGAAKTFTGTVNLDLANPGDYNITVEGASTSDPDTTDTCTACFSVLASAPVLISTDTPALAQGGSALVTFSGTRFARGNYAGADSNYACTTCTDAPTLEFRVSGESTPAPGIQLGDPSDTPFDTAVAATATTITKKVTVLGSAAVGSYDIYVENTDGKSTLLAGGLTVEPGLAVATVTPATRGVNSLDGEVIVTGTNFPADISGSITLPGIGVNGVTYGFVRDSATQVRFTNVAVSSSATVGPRSIKLSSASRHASVTDSTSFAVTDAPSVSSIAANDSHVTRAYGQGATNVQLTLNGSGFVDGAQLSFSPGTGITVNSTNVVDSAVVADISIDSSAPTGNVAVSVVNGDGGRPLGSCPGSSCTLVIKSAPTITAISPSHGARGATVNVTITGVNLADGTTKTPPTITWSGGTVTNVVAVNATTVTAKINVDAGATGVYDLAIRNNDDRGQAVCVLCFTADSLGVTGASASSALNDHTETGVVVTGNGFAPNATIQLVKTGTGSATVPPIDGVVTAAPTESSPGAADGTSITADFDLNGVDPGSYEFRVTNPTGPHAGSGQGFVFTVVALSPSISSVSPNSRGGGAVDQTVVITGTDFGPSATVAFSNSAIHVDSTTVDSSTQITLVIHIDKIASADDSGAVSVINTDNNNDSSAFSLVVGPTITGGATVTQARGAADVAFQLTGDQGTFPSTANAQLTATGAGVSFSGVTATPGVVLADDTLDATLHVTQGAGLGPHDVVLVDSSTGGRDVCEGCVVVTSGPVIDSIAPSYGRPGHDVVVSIAGSHFQEDATVEVTDGITVSGVSASANSITATFTIPSGLAPGTSVDVTVTNPADGGSQTLASGFDVVEVPGAPTGVTATAGDTTADVSWTAPSANGGTIDTYTVTAQPTNGSDPEVTQSVTGSPAATNLTVTGLTDGVEYEFVVVASNEVGAGPASAPSAPVTPKGAPAKVTGVGAHPLDASAYVFWDAPANNGAEITQYTVTAVSPTSPSGDVVDTVTGTPAATHLTITGLVNGTEYRFKVFATNSEGDGPESALSDTVTPVVKSSLTIAKSRSKITYGQKTTISGTLSEAVSGDALAGEEVLLYGKTSPSGVYSWIGTFVTDADGGWSTEVSPHRKTVYYASYLGNGMNGAVTSPLAALKVGYRISWVSPKPGSTVPHGRTLIKVKVRDIVPGAVGTLLAKRADGTVVKLDTAKLGTKGLMTFRTFLGTGIHRIAVKVAGKGGCSTTRTRFVKIIAS